MMICWPWHQRSDRSDGAVERKGQRPKCLSKVTQGSARQSSIRPGQDCGMQKVNIKEIGQLTEI